MATARPDEPFHEARRQVGKRGGRWIGDAGEGMKPREQVARRPLLKRGDRLIALLGPLPPQAVAHPLEVPRRPQATRTLRRLGLGPGERLAERVEPVDWNLRGPLGKRGKPPADPLDERPLEFLVHGQERSDLVDPLHPGKRHQFGLSLEQLLAGVGDRQGVPDALIALLEELLLQFDALQPLGLHVEQVVVVAELVETAGHRQCDGHAAEDHDPRMPEDRGEPGMHRHRLGDRAAKEAAVDDREHGRQHEQFRGTAQHDAAARDHPELCHAHEARHRRREEGDGRRDRAGENPRPHAAARLEQGVFAVHALAPLLQVAADVVRAVVDAHTDHRHRERDAEDVEVANARRRPRECPGHADRQHRIGHQGMPHAAKAGDDHEDHRGHRQATRPDHRGLAGPHLVVLHDRDAGETDRNARVALGDAGDDPPQFVRRSTGAGKAALFLGESEQHEAQAAILGEKVLAGKIAERGERLGHPRPRRDIIGRSQIAGDGRLEPGHQALNVPLQ